MNKLNLFVMLCLTVALSTAFAHDGTYEEITQQMPIDAHILELQEKFEDKTFIELDNSLANMFKNEQVLFKITKENEDVYYIYIPSDSQKIGKFSILKQTLETDEQITDWYMQSSAVVTLSEYDAHKLIHSPAPITEFKELKSSKNLRIDTSGFIATMKMFFFNIALFFIG
jgi:hypothetical protein